MSSLHVNKNRKATIVSPGGGMIFVPSTRQNGAIAKLQEPGWGQIQGGDDFRQSSRGGLLYHDELLVFPQNASP